MDDEIAGQVTEHPVPLIRHNNRFADSDREDCILAQCNRHVEHHVGAKFDIYVMVEAQNIALTPVRRKRDAQAVSGFFAVSFGAIVRVDDGLHCIVDIGTGVAGFERFETCLEGLKADRVEAFYQGRDGAYRNRAEQGRMVAIVGR